jgi:hypothetical protein
MLKSNYKSPKVMKSNVMADARKKADALRRENKPIMKTGGKAKFKTHTKF